MAQSVKLADDVMTLVQREARLHGRSVADQITHWLMLGRAAENSGARDRARISAAPVSGAAPERLKDEDVAWLDQFTDEMSRPSRSEEDFFARRQALGQGTGLDAAGNIVHAEVDEAR